MRCTRNEDGARLNVMLNGEVLEEADQFRYLGSVIAANGGVEADVRHRVNEGCKVLGALKRVMKNRGLGMNVKKVLYEKVVVPAVMYGSESGGMKVNQRQKVNVFEMKCLRSMTGVSRLDRDRNEVVRARTGVRRELAARIDMNVLRWFGYEERMDMEISLKLESMPTLCRSVFLPADTTITRRVAATIEVASSVVHRKEYCFGGIKNNNILPASQQLTREPL